MIGCAPARLVVRHGRWLVGLTVALACALSAAPASAVMVKLPAGGYANYELMKGAQLPSAKPRQFDAMFSNLDYSGGPVMHSNTNYVVEWMPSNYTGTPFQDNSGGTYNLDYVGGMQQFFKDLAADSGSSSNTDSVATQYNDTSGGVAAYDSHYGGALPVDSDPLPANGCPANTGHICINDGQIQQELDSFLAKQGVPADLAHEYFLLTPPDVASCFDSTGSAGCSANQDTNQQYCAYHSRTSVGGYLYSNIPDVTGNIGCDPYSAGYAYNNGPADGMLSAVSHEHIESITDPEPNNAWTDWQPGCTPTSVLTCGGEIGDKCNSQTTYQTINGTNYVLQAEWSNQHTGGTGGGCVASWSANGNTAHASFTATPGSGNVVSFNAAASSATGAVAQYVWQFNDNTPANGIQNFTIETTSPTISHTFPGPGTYTVALTVMGSDGTSNGAAAPVNVYGAPTAVFAASDGTEGVPITFNGSSSTDPNPGGTLSYAWDFGDNGRASGPVVAHPFAPGPYTVTLTVTDSASGLTSSVSHAVRIDELPSVAFNPPSGTAGRPVTFNGSGSDPDGWITSYGWNFGDGQTGTGASASHTYSQPGKYTVTLTVVDSSGVTASAVRAVTIVHAHPSQSRCVVPKLKGDTLGRARALLSGARCSVGKVKTPKKPNKSPGAHKKWVLLVAGQSPGAGSSAPAGNAVKLTMGWKAVNK